MLEERSHPDLKRWGFLFTEAVLIVARLGFKMHTTGEYQAALEAVDEILAEIDRSMAQLGAQ